MGGRRLRRLLAAGSCVLALSVGETWAQNTQIQTLPVGAGAIGKGPDAMTPPGYEDAPRPPAFTDEVRKENARIIQLVDNYTPQPAWAGQTRAPKPARTAEFDVETIFDRLSGQPFSFHFLPDGRMIVSERSNGIRIIDRNGRASEYITGLPLDMSKPNRQMFEVIPDRNFAQNRTIYFLYREPPPQAQDIVNHPVHYPQIMMVARGRLSEDDRQLTDVKVLLNTQSIIGRMIQAPDGTLFIDAAPLAGRGMLSRNWTQSQLPGSLMGKVLRINTDGTIPKDNPFIGRPDTRPEIWAFGIRDGQSMALDAEGRLWIAENGPMGGDELNLVEKGKNYGFPTISYGREYNAEPINGNLTAKEGLEQPVYFWTPSIAPSGMTFYTGDLFPEWKGDLFIASLSPLFGRKIHRLSLARTPQGWRVTGEEFLLEGTRFRDVKQGPDGALYAMTDNQGEGAKSNKIIRLVPKKK